MGYYEVKIYYKVYRVQLVKAECVASAEEIALEKECNDFPDEESLKGFEGSEGFFKITATEI